MDNPTFEAGDQVVHHSGGPRMVVLEEAKTGNNDHPVGYRARWWDPSGKKFEDKTFYPFELRAYDPVAEAAAMMPIKG